MCVCLFSVCASPCLNIRVCVCGLVSQSWVNELAAAAKRTCNGFVLIKVLCHESGDMLSALTGTPSPLPLPTFESLWHSDWGGWRVHSASSHSTWHTHKSQGVSGDKKLPDKLIGIPGQQCHVGPSCLRCNFLGWLCCLHASITKDLWAKLALLFEKHGVSFNSGIINDYFVRCNSLIFILQRKITNIASKYMVVNWYIEKHSVYLAMHSTNRGCKQRLLMACLRYFLKYSDRTSAFYLKKEKKWSSC